MRTPQQNEHVGLPPVLRNVLIAMAVLVVVALTTESICDHIARFQAEPYNTAFLPGLFPDFYVFTERFKHFHSPAFFSTPGVTYMYPATLAIVYKLLYAAPGDPMNAFLAFTSLSLVIGCQLLGRELFRRGVVPWQAFSFPYAILALSYPVWFEFKQGNLEIFMWIVIAGGIALFLKGRGYSAAACFGLAAAMKIFPIVLMGLLLVRRQYRQIAWGLVIGAIVMVSAVWLIDPNIVSSWDHINAGLTEFREKYVLHRRMEMGFDHSLLTLIKQPLTTFPGPDEFASVLTGYIVVMALAGLSAFALRLWRMPAVNQILCLTVVFVSFPPVSFEYTLIHIFIPFFMLVLLAVDAKRENVKIAGLGGCLCCCVVLLGCLPEVIVNQQRVGGQVKAFTLGILFLLGLRYPLSMPDREAVGELEAQARGKDGGMVIGVEVGKGDLLAGA